jgi:hypothetical protein
VCRVLRKALSGGFHLKRLNVNGARYREQPEKNSYSHVAEALECVLLGGGAGRDALRLGPAAQVRRAKLTRERQEFALT